MTFVKDAERGFITTRHLVEQLCIRGAGKSVRDVRGQTHAGKEGEAKGNEQAPDSREESRGRAQRTVTNICMAFNQGERLRQG
ncbi:hypothetical protein BGE01nite_56430 [Brevifollis gellanilyticus]|uniref:Uncharacterized protein n=1 Tax=Brevifollis gellanilyticus TaxID=748831 RepID=A0A512MHZ3_9BACT|nr:hypothetical protein BGE01nite_56430 [Brevifollis gellanilyticus]